jgi:RHS repeat-associated protein
MVILESRKGMQGKNQIFTKSGAVAYINEYYPFGLVNQQTSSTQYGSKEQRYKYNGKELMKDFKLEMEDYGARMYSPQIGRWTMTDQKAEKYTDMSPYTYAANNPIKFIDPNGKEIYISYMVRVGGEVIFQRVQYKDGGLYNSDGSKFTSGNAYFNSVRDHLNNAKSRDPYINSMLTDLETSENYHEITNSIERVGQLTEQASSYYDNANYDISFGKHVIFGKNGEKIDENTVTYFPNPYADTKDVQTGDKEGVITHELQHAHDKQTGVFKGLENRENKAGLKFSEINAVRSQNFILRSKQKYERMMYGDKAITNDDFNNID